MAISHFAINADDVERALAFYQGVFGWKFEAWGPPGFYTMEGANGVRAALQRRRELVPGVRMVGFECTVGVPSIDDVEREVLARGGKVLMARAVIPTVGTLMFFQDPEGNAFGAMQYEPRAAQP